MKRFLLSVILALAIEQIKSNCGRDWVIRSTKIIESRKLYSFDLNRPHRYVSCERRGKELDFIIQFIGSTCEISIDVSNEEKFDLSPFKPNKCVNPPDIDHDILTQHNPVVLSDEFKQQEEVAERDIWTKCHHSLIGYLHHRFSRHFDTRKSEVGFCLINYEQMKISTSFYNDHGGCLIEGSLNAENAFTFDPAIDLTACRTMVEIEVEKAKSKEMTLVRHDTPLGVSEEEFQQMEANIKKYIVEIPDAFKAYREELANPAIQIKPKKPIEYKKSLYFEEAMKQKLGKIISDIDEDKQNIL